MLKSILQIFHRNALTFCELYDFCVGFLMSRIVECLVRCPIWGVVSCVLCGGLCPVWCCVSCVVLCVLCGVLFEEWCPVSCVQWRPAASPGLGDHRKSAALELFIHMSSTVGSLLLLQASLAWSRSAWNFQPAPAGASIPSCELEGVCRQFWGDRAKLVAGEVLLPLFVFPGHTPI